MFFTVLTIVGSIASIQSAGWLLSEEATSDPSTQARIRARLITSPGDEEFSTSRIRLRNVGNNEIADIEALVYSSTYAQSEGEFAVPRTLGPQEEIDVAELSNLIGQIVLTVKYTAQGESYVWQFEFLVPSTAPTTGGEFAPSKIAPKTEQAFLSKKDRIRDSLPEGLHDPEGTIVLKLSETHSSGKPNVVTIAGGDKLFMFDCRKRVATFRAGSSAPLVVRFSQKEVHFVAFSWEDNRPTMLAVDDEITEIPD